MWILLYDPTLDSITLNGNSQGTEPQTTGTGSQCEYWLTSQDS